MTTDRAYCPSLILSALSHRRRRIASAIADLLRRQEDARIPYDAIEPHPTNNYGPNQHPEKFIRRLITNALRGKPLPIHGRGQNIRDWIFVEDNCRAIHTVSENRESGEVYNVSGDNEKKNIDVAMEIQASIGACISRGGANI